MLKQNHKSTPLSTTTGDKWSFWCKLNVCELRKENQSVESNF